MCVQERVELHVMRLWHYRIHLSRTMLIPTNHGRQLPALSLHQFRPVPRSRRLTKPHAAAFPDTGTVSSQLSVMLFRHWLLHFAERGVLQCSRPLAPSQRRLCRLDVRGARAHHHGSLLAPNSFFHRCVHFSFEPCAAYGRRPHTPPGCSCQRNRCERATLGRKQLQRATLGRKQPQARKAVPVSSKEGSLRNIQTDHSRWGVSDYSKQTRHIKTTGVPEKAKKFSKQYCTH